MIVSTIDDIFGKPSASQKRAQAKAFKDSFAFGGGASGPSSSLTTNKVHQSLVQKKPAQLPPAVKHAPPTSQAVPLAQPKPERIQFAAEVQQPEPPKPPRSEFPNYLRPRQPPKTEFEAEAASAVSRARGLVSMLAEMEALAVRPDLDPAYRRRKKQADAEQRAREFKQITALMVETKAAQRAARAERALEDLEYEKHSTASRSAIKRDMKRATVSLQRSLKNDPILRSAMAERERRARTGEESVQLPRVAGASGHGHDKHGDEVLRKARRVAAKALAQAGV